jgi:hypothetical protein
MTRGAARVHTQSSDRYPLQRLLNGDNERERRLELLVRRLPPRLQATVRWLLKPSARWVRIPAGLFLILGGVLSILPILGLWMLPLGLVLIAEDVALLRRVTGRLLAWIEYRRPHWLGLSRVSHVKSSTLKEQRS